MLQYYVFTTDEVKMTLMVTLILGFLVSNIIISIYLLENFAAYFSNYAASNKRIL